MQPADRTSYEFGPFRFDATERLLYRGSDVVPLTPKVADTLLVLLSRQGTVVEKSELLRLVWPDTNVEEGGLARNISMLRKALEDEADGCRYIETIPKRGYRFAAQSDPGAPPVSGHHPRRRVTVALLVAAAILIAAALYLAFLRKTPERLGARPAVIAVLPLKNLSGDPGQEYFSEGMTDMLVTELARSGVRVIAPASARRLRSGAPMDKLGEQLGADAVVQGTVLVSAGRVRINAQMMEVRTGRLLWADSYERALRDVLALQAEVAGAVAREVSANAQPSGKPAPPPPRTILPAAFDAYLKGRFFWNKRTEAGLRKAIEYFNDAAAKDPTYAPAYAGLADAYALLGSTGYDAIPPRQAMPLAKAAAERALALDSRLAAAHVSLAYCRMAYDWDFDAAGKEFQEALRLDPTYPTAHQWYGHLALASGQLDQAASRFQEASRLDPLSLPASVGVGWCSYFARRYDDAIREYHKTLELDPDFALAHQTLGMALEQKGAYAEAILEFQRAVALSESPGSIASLGHAYALAGFPMQAKAQLARLADLSRHRYVPAIYQVLIRLGLGDRASAAPWFSRAVAERSEYLIYLQLDPAFDAVRNDPRFRVVLGRPE
jgi:TolB-like protein/DNA-binding winged helix-turn-helix (wHTH) protein/Flp pilus assembly protein TadD